MLGGRRTKIPANAMITLERAQKLDLLMHLISNLSQSLVICGSEGIGKTRLVETLLESNRDNGPICVVQGAAGLSYEAVLSQFSRQLLEREPQFSGQDLTAILQHYQKGNSHVVLIIEDAGLLVPGLISALIQYANANNAIRLVLTLTHDDLHIKHSSDSIIDECHFIEIPPLSKKQCMTFLQNLSAQPGATISFNAVNEVLVDNLYSVTHGIPGRILAELPRLSEYQAKAGRKWGVAGLVLTGMVLAGVGVILNQEERPFNERQAEPLRGNQKVPANMGGAAAINQEKEQSFDNEANKWAANPLPTESWTRSVADDEGIDGLFKPEKLDRIAIQPPIVQSEETVSENELVVGTGENATDSETETAAAMPEDNASEAGQKSVNRLDNDSVATQIVMSEGSEEAEGSEKEPTISNRDEGQKGMDDGESWVLGQNKDHYTLQLMVLSQQQSVNRLLKKYPSHKQAIRQFRMTKHGQEKYVLIYGNFSSAAEATKAKKALPAVFQNAWARKFKVLQKQITSQ